jgi:hypothetical protein
VLGEATSFSVLRIRLPVRSCRASRVRRLILWTAARIPLTDSHHARNIQALPLPYPGETSLCSESRSMCGDKKRTWSGFVAVAIESDRLGAVKKWPAKPFYVGSIPTRACNALGLVQMPLISDAWLCKVGLLVMTSTLAGTLEIGHNEKSAEGSMAHEIRWNPELQEWFCSRCGRTSDHAVREDAETELEVFPCELYEHVIHRYRPTDE